MPVISPCSGAASPASVLWHWPLQCLPAEVFQAVAVMLLACCMRIWIWTASWPLSPSLEMVPLIYAPVPISFSVLPCILQRLLFWCHAHRATWEFWWTTWSPRAQQSPTGC